MSAHGHGNPLFKIIGLLLLVAFVVGGVIYFFRHFPLFTITAGTAPTPREFQPYQLVKPSTTPKPPVSTTSPLKNTKWAWQYTEKASGLRDTPSDAGQFILSFGANKDMSSTTDCNSISGTYATTGSSLRFGAFISTLMYCEGSLENLYRTDLEKVGMYAVVGDELQLTLGGATGVMVFTKRH